MIRKIIRIDKTACTGCGLCAEACHEGAIVMLDGKAELLRDDYCDGLGDCLPACPAGAITFVEREAAAYNEKAVQAHKNARQPGAPLPSTQPEQTAQPAAAPATPLSCGCPGTQSKIISRPAAPAHTARTENAAYTAVTENTASPAHAASGASAATAAYGTDTADVSSQLSQWPVQIKLVPLTAPYFDGAHLLIAADCTAYAYGNFHRDFIKGKITLVGCPKLDAVDYTEKLTGIIRGNNIKSVTVVRMEVPCCGGIQNAAVNALKASGKFIPWNIVTIATDGTILPV